MGEVIAGLSWSSSLRLCARPNVEFNLCHRGVRDEHNTLASLAFQFHAIAPELGNKLTAFAAGLLAMRGVGRR